ncbi:MAG: hypothetical protein JWO38_7544 [Gemmataceae bacterium]|nr:hypothetical protein [Gemmataceae bacterium]
MHIPKTAGTTFRWIAEQQYPAGSLHTLYPGHGPQLEQLEAVARTKPPVAVMGHFRFGLHTRLPTATRYVTFFRDPIDQVVSLYNYLTFYDDPSNRGVLRAGDQLADFLAHGWARNLQTQYLTGLTPAEVEADPDRTYERALDVLAGYFDGFGVVERFSESVDLLAGQLGWRVPSYPVLNQSPGGARRLRRRALSRSAIEGIEAANVCDRRLYEHAREVVRQRVRRGPNRPYPKHLGSAAKWLVGRLQLPL